ncbi:hypothetical protein C8J57DRAFT_1250541 [Mycena rebaudengoi]|nr:hypothetical protein C8J57DRAFT_1250541 [Mycena rebaudengoi]
MSKHHQPGRKKRKELGLDTYSPGLSQAQLKKNHRQSVHEHYMSGTIWRNADSIREKRRIQMAEKKRAKQLLRRRWDAPKRQSVPEAAAQLKATGSTIDRRLENASLNDTTISDGVGDAAPQDLQPGFNAGSSPRTTGSRPPEELVASRGPVLLGQIALRVADSVTNSRDSVLQRAINLERLTATNLDGNSANMLVDPVDVTEDSCGSSPPVDEPNDHGQALLPPMKLMEETQMEPIYAGALSRVQAAQLSVTKLNSGTLTAPTEEDRASWNACRIRHLRIIKESILPEQENSRIRGWTVDVADALGNHLYWELDSEEEAECRRAEEDCQRNLNGRRRYRYNLG